MASASGLQVYPRVCGGARRRHSGVNCVVGVYPRVYGGAVDDVFDAMFRRCEGLSPRVRGSLADFTSLAGRVIGQVYPRVCGGAP